MKILGAALFLFISTSAAAMWANYSDADLVAQSDLIVFGEITATKPIPMPAPQTALNAAVLRVNASWKGGGNPAEVLLVMPPAEGARSSTDIFYQVGQTGLWFLRRHPQAGNEGVYLADHPQRYIPAGETERIKVFRGLLGAAHH
jgi:hypothetical protein